MPSVRDIFLDGTHNRGKVFGHGFCYAEARKTEEDTKMKGYYSVSGFYGLVNGRYVLFSSENDYSEVMEED